MVENSIAIGITDHTTSSPSLSAPPTPAAFFVGAIDYARTAMEPNASHAAKKWKMGRGSFSDLSLS